MAVHDDDSCREAFERYWSRSRGERKHRDRINERRQDGSYSDVSAQRHWWTWQNAMRSTGTPAAVHLAFEIADEAMYELLESEGMPLDEHRTTFGFIGEGAKEVTSLAESSPAMREAFDWLKERGYAELGSDKDGEFAQVVRRPGEDT